MKLLIIGHGGHGKDAALDVLTATHGFAGCSSSEFAARKAVFPMVSDMYPNWQAAYADRRNHRDLWFHAIAAYNLKPGPMLAEQILASHDIYVGMRKRAEFEATHALFDFVLWIDRSDHCPPESRQSMELTRCDADIEINNNGDLDDLFVEVSRAVIRMREAVIAGCLPF